MIPEIRAHYKSPRDNEQSDVLSPSSSLFSPISSHMLVVSNLYIILEPAELEWLDSFCLRLSMEIDWLDDSFRLRQSVDIVWLDSFCLRTQASKVEQEPSRFKDSTSRRRSH